MDHDDARRLSPAEQHERRRQVIRAWKRGIKKRQIGRDVGLSYSAVCKIIDRYEAEGAKSLLPRTRGRKTGEQRVLNAQQEAHIQRLICERRPEQLKMDFALWSRPAVQQLIERECGIHLHVRSVGKYLARWGFTPQKPIRRAYEQSPQAVKAWLDDEYPAIAKRAKAENAEIHWGDETALVNTDVRGRSFAPKGQTPVVRVIGGTRQKLSMISTVTNQGKARWMIIDGAFNHEKLIEFFEALVKDADRKVFLILDNLGVHHCKPVKAWLAEHVDQIEVFYLPSYSPELNPDERLNAELKHVIGSRVPARTKDKLRAVTNEHMAQLERQHERIRAYFRDPRIKYAA
ncbi:endonuclease DDE [Lampropedia cohaerens]|uniref:Endonuclease DDE n=1 Tax=Lampropedia cohaerens TaxID=1610491 RepID=A0A0U1PZR5_9BURK|nr:IS630 family transposase [Lampropedia cohaerens]KKW68004.1 endonuclease DDE [Lampropedia cohaerens]